MIDRPTDPEIKYIIDKIGFTDDQLTTLTQGYCKKLPPVSAGASLLDQIERINTILNYVATLETIAKKKTKTTQTTIIKVR